MNTNELQQVEARNTLKYLIAGLFVIFALTGCVTTSKVVADDSHVFLPSIRVGISLEDGKQAPSEPQTGKAIEFEVVKTKGSGDQFLAPGQSPIVLNNTTFIAPQQIKNDFDFNYADVSFRWRKFFRERSVGLEVSGGFGHTSLGLNMYTPTQRASEHFATYGPQGGVAFIWRMRASTSLHARVSGFVSRSDTGISDFGRYEVFLAQALGDNLALRAGYAKWEVNGAAGMGQSDFRTIFSGPVLDIGLNF